MADAYLNAKLLMDMLGKMLRGIDGAMLSTRAAEREHQRCKTTLHIAAHVSIRQLIDGIEESKNFTIILQEADNWLIKSRQLLVRFVATRVVGAATIEHITAPVARFILGNALAVRETIYPNDKLSLPIIFGGRGSFPFNRLESGLFGEPIQKFHQVRIVEKVRAFIIRKQFAKILNGRGNGGNEMVLPLEIASEAVSAKHLKRTEKHEKRQASDKMAHGRHLNITLQRIVILADELTAEFVGILSRGLPEEGGKVIIIRSAAPTLIINEVRLSIYQHDIARLKVAIEETGRCRGLSRLANRPRIRGEVFGKQTEIRLQFQFVELKSDGFQKAILEIIEVEQHTLAVKLRLRKATGEVESMRTAYLDIR